MKLRSLGLLGIVIAGLVTALAVTAEPAGRTWRVGYLSLVEEDLEQYKPWFTAFRDGLRERGYIEGNNLIIEQRYADGHIGRLPALAAELLRLRVDVLVTAPAGSALAASKATGTIPIVFIGEPDPVGTGLVTSLARPGGNVTGLADSHADLVPKRLELLKELVPTASEIGVLWNPSNASTAPQIKTVLAASPALGLHIVPFAVKGRDDLDRAFVAIGKDHLGGLLVVADPTLGNQRRRIAELAIAHRLPASGTHRGWTEGGLFMSYGTDFAALFRRGAAIVDKLLKGAKPATLPVEQPTRFELVINATTAKSIGLAIPPSVLARADAVIQ